MAVQVSSNDRPTALDKREMIDSVQNIDNVSKDVCQIVKNIADSRSSEEDNSVWKSVSPATNNGKQVITQLTNHFHAVLSPIQV